MTRGSSYLPADVQLRDSKVVAIGVRRGGAEGDGVHAPMCGFVNAIFLGAVLWTFVLVAVLVF